MTREERLDWLCRLRSNICVYMPKEWIKPMNEALTDSIKALEQESRIEWIPVSDELPEEKYYCLCCDEEGYITVGYFSVLSKEWCFVDMEIDIDVIAWMPLPEPYKEEVNG